MVFTIHRYIFYDLVKKFLLGTLVLSVMLGLGVMLRPLQKYSIDPSRVPELVLCTMPITLTMVMPITALLAATLTYGRLASDRELDACRASGIGLTTLVYPALTLALLVGMVTLLLAFHVIPSYTERFEKIIQEDAEGILYRNIEKSGRLEEMFQDVVVHVDRAYPETHQLTGVAALRVGRENFLEIITVRQVDVKLMTDRQPSEIMLRFHDAQRVSSRGEMLSVGKFELTRQIKSLWQDNIKFKKLSDLKAIREDMSLFGPIAQLKKTLSDQLMVERFFNWCDRQLHSGEGLLELVGSELTRLEVSAGACEMKSVKHTFEERMAEKSKTAGLFGEGDWPIRVDYYDGRTTGPRKEYLAKSGWLSIDADLPEPRLIMTLEDLEWRYTNDLAHPHFPPRVSFSPLRLPEAIISQVRSLDLAEMLSTDFDLGVAEPSAYLVKLKDNLVRTINTLQTDIEVELHSRLAFGVSCVVLVLLGTALGIIFRSGHLLTAFGVSFIPAGLCLISIVTGKHIAEQSNIGIGAGVMFLWSGIVLVGIANLVVYKRLTKN